MLLGRWCARTVTAHILPCAIFVGFKPTGDYHVDPNYDQRH